MKHKIIPFLLCSVLMYSNIFVFADENNFDAADAFKDYFSFDDSQTSENIKHYYIVSKSNEENSKALFSEDIQLTDFAYENIDVTNGGIIVSRNENDTEYFGLIDEDDHTEILPIKYKSIENCEIGGYIAENTLGEKEYYAVRAVTEYISVDVECDKTDKLFIFKNNEDFKSFFNSDNSENTEKELTPVKGLDNCYIMDDGSGFYELLVDSEKNPLIDARFRKIDRELSPGDTLVVWYPVGMSDLRGGVLNKNFEVIVPNKDYGTPEFIESSGEIYIKVTDVIAGGDPDYYDLNGNIIDKSKEAEILSGSKIAKTDNLYSKWAEDSIKQSIELGLVPENLQSEYIKKITRQEFCRLAVQTYIAKTGSEIDVNAKTPFTDVDDAYITTACNLKIVSGVGGNKFAPDNTITRQEAAVMIYNLAEVLNIDNTAVQTSKFVDESYFAAWAKSEIYSVSAIKSGDTFVMTGTGNGKFSPWMNYTREQAIATMYRLYMKE